MPKPLKTTMLPKLPGAAENQGYSFKKRRASGWRNFEGMCQLKGGLSPNLGSTRTGGLSPDLSPSRRPSNGASARLNSLANPPLDSLRR